MAAKGKKTGRGAVVIRREEIAEAGHHGGAWKVAYADFVTAMMAFFLLMWLLNATTDAQRKGLADYFTPSNALSRASSGSGQPFGGRTPYDDGSAVSDRGAESVVPGTSTTRPDQGDADQAGHVDNDREDGGDAEPDATSATTARQARDAARRQTRAGGGPTAASAIAGPRAGVGPLIDGRTISETPPRPDPQTLREAELRAELARRERDSFDQAAAQIRDAVSADPALADLARQLVIDQTPEGLRVQLLDDDRQPMFANASAIPNDRARLLLQKIAPVLARLPEQISISGHTDAARFAGVGRSNWELSSERANETRRLLTDGGLPEARFRSVTGNADRDPMVPSDPLAAANRRIAILVLRAAPL